MCWKRDGTDGLKALALLSKLQVAHVIVAVLSRFVLRRPFRPARRHDHLHQTRWILASDIEAAEKEQVSARNKVPIDQDNLMKKAKDSAVSKSQKEIDAAKTEVESQKSSILKKGKKNNSDMKKKADGKVDAAADKFIKEFLESLS